jgi:hypothetical protein
VPWNGFRADGAQLTLAMIVQRYQLHSPDQLDVRPDPYVTLRPTGEVPMLVWAR